MDARVEAAAKIIMDHMVNPHERDEQMLDCCRDASRAALAAADAVDPLRASHARLLGACTAAQALGSKRYHISTAHEAPHDWAEVKTLLDAAIAAAAEGGGQ